MRRTALHATAVGRAGIRAGTAGDAEAAAAAAARQGGAASAAAGSTAATLNYARAKKGRDGRLLALLLGILRSW